MNYYGKSRSNEFKVKNITKLIKLADKFDFDITVSKDSRTQIIEECENGKIRIKPRKTVVLSSNSEGGDLECFYDEDTREEVNICEEIQEMLCDGELCIITHVGSEGYRYFCAGYTLITKDSITGKDLFNELEDTLKTSVKSPHNKELWF